jgi:DNA-binding beta-propeller fold protein YncE
MKMKNTFATLLSATIMTGWLACAAHADNGLLLVCNKGDRTLGIVNPDTGTQVAEVPEDGITGHEVVASADGRLAFVPIYGNSGVGHPGTDGQLIRVIDLEKRAIVGTVDFGKGVRPHCAVIGPKNKLLYVTAELENAIEVIDPKTFKILYSVPTGQSESHMLAIASNGRYGYTANVGPGTVSVLDLKRKKTVKIIPICKTTQRICISPDDKWVFTSDQATPRLAVIDTKKNEVAQWIEMPGVGYGGAVTPDGKSLVIALPAAKKAALIDLAQMKVVQTVDLPKAPQEVVIQPDGKVAYVSCDASKQVAAISLPDLKVQKLINAGKGADGLAWAQTK